MPMVCQLILYAGMCPLPNCDTSNTVEHGAQVQSICVAFGLGICTTAFVLIMSNMSAPSLQGVSVYSHVVVLM